MKPIRSFAVLLASTLMLSAPILPVYGAASTGIHQNASSVLKNQSSNTDDQDPKDNSGNDPAAEKKSVTSRLSILNTRVQKDGKSLTRISRDESFDLLIQLKDTGIRTEDLIPESIMKEYSDHPDKMVEISSSLIEVSHVVDDFSAGKEPRIYLRSSADQTLSVLVVFSDLEWDGEGNTFSFDYGYPENKNLSIHNSYTEKSIQLKQCKEDPAKDPSDTNEPKDPAAVDPDPGYEDPGDYYDPGTTYTDNPDPAQIAAATPYIIVEKYTYGGDQVLASTTFDLEIICKNTSKTLPVENIMVSLETEEGLSITSSSNTFYIDKIAPSATRSLKIKMKALGSDKSSSPAINISFRYEYVDNDQRISQNSSEKISIPVVEPDRLEITEPVLPDVMYAGEEIVLSFDYVNKGKGTLSNVAVKVDGNVPALSQVQNLGNFESGKSGSIDVVLTPEMAGSEKVKVLLSYENASGEPVTKTYSYDMQFLEQEPYIPEDPGFEPAEAEPEKSSSVFLWILLAALLVAGFLIWRYTRKKTASKADVYVDEEDWSIPSKSASSQKEDPVPDRTSSDSKVVLDASDLPDSAESDDVHS